MKYIHVLAYVAQTPWAILESKMDDLLEVLAYRAAGHVFTAEEIQARLGPPAPSAAPNAGEGVAIIPLRGVIAHRMGSMSESSGGMSAERFTAMMQQAAADPRVAAILIDVDSPGGTIPGVLEAADAVYQARETKKVVAIANSVMASAAYWIASQAHELVAIPSALDPSIGAIGAFMVHQDVSAALEKEGIKTTVIKAGKFKAEGLFEPLSDDRRASLQAVVDGAYAQFVKAVARGRGVAPADVRGGYGEGRALTASDALRAGLIDRIATMDETIARLASPQARARIGNTEARASSEVEVAAAPAAIASEADDRVRRVRL